MPAFGPKDGTDLFEMIKKEKHYRFLVNNNQVASFTDKVSRSGQVQLTVGSFGVPGRGVFKDIKVQRLE